MGDTLPRWLASPHLTDLRLHANEISDVSALVANDGLATGDKIRWEDNPLDELSLCEEIPALVARGVNVGWWDNPTIECPEPSAVLLQLAALTTLFVIVRRRGAAAT